MTTVTAPPVPTDTTRTAQIGPNALIQTVNAIRELADEHQLLTMLQRCQQENLLDAEPTSMVDERLFAELTQAVTDVLGVPMAQSVLQRSGERTAAYLLQHRIPGPFQRLLHLLPRRLALRTLLIAINQHAWTFTGSGQFTYQLDKRPLLTVISTIEPGPVAAAFYGGTFCHLLQTLVEPDLQLQVSTTAFQNNTICAYVVQYSNYS